MGLEISTVIGPQYYLIAFDKYGVEQVEPDGTRISDTLRRLLENSRFTDVIIIIHGWKGDIKAARQQFNCWIAAMAKCESDISRARQIRQDFKPLIIGFHWPSLPWGDEELAPQSVSFDLLDDTLQLWLNNAAQKTVDTLSARAALRVLALAALEQMYPPKLPDAVINAYKTLFEETFISDQKESTADMDVFNPAKSYHYRDEAAVSFGGGSDSGLLAPLIQLSFWQMKKRAQTIGESAGTNLLVNLQNAAHGKSTRFHVMGHSFGCIVASAMVSGNSTESSKMQANSLILVQGALSLWSYSSSVAALHGQPGYFHHIIKQQLVDGPIITTQSKYDTAVGKLYPWAAGVAGPASYETKLMKYGALGAFGARGDGVNASDIPLAEFDAPYRFEKGKIYNVECSSIIRHGAGLSGAHNDIDHPEVAHLVWEAMLAGS